MTKKKRRELETQKEAERRQMEREEQAQSAMYYPGISYGSLNGCVLPVSNGKMKVVQLPPIIQPISFVPVSTQMPAEKSTRKDDFDDFDDFDDWD